MATNNLKKLFKNRLGYFRAGWRILIFLGMTIVCFIPVAGLLKLWDVLSPDKAGTGGSDEFTSLVMIIFYLGLDVAIILGSWLTLRWIDKRPYALLGFDFNRGAWKEFLKGFLLGFINFLIIFLILKCSGVIETQFSTLNLSLFKGILIYFITFTVAAVFEELFNRGYIFQALIEGTRAWIAVMIISLLFVAGHSTNTGFSWNNAVFFFIHSILYCLLYIKTGSIWTPIGFHLSWNWTQGSIFGMNVSGTVMKNTLLTTKPIGPEILSGGEFGAEASIISSIISVILILLILKYSWPKPAVFRIKLWNKYTKSSDH